MHWFDRMSRQLAAVPTRTTRRGALRGAAVAAVVAPFAPGALAYANRRLKAQNSTEDCLNCLSRSAGRTRAAVALCKAETPKADRALLRPKGGGGGGGKGSKGKKGMKPTEASRRAACMARAAQRFLGESDNCVKIECAGLGETAPPPAHPTPGGGGSTCPSGTTLCSGSLCCYGGDNCCPCASVDGGMICCAAVIQCSCC
jgi:hypothetical protein